MRGVEPRGAGRMFSRMADPAVPSAQPPVELAGTTLRTPGPFAAGLEAVGVTTRLAVAAMGPVRGAKLLLEVNQKNGFDCQSCAWPSPDGDRHTFEFCENGAKAVADEATKRRVGREFFRAARSRGARGAERPLAQRARAPHGTDGAARGRGALRADRVGRGLRAHRDGAARAADAGCGGVLHLGADEQRGGVSLAIVRAAIRDEQPAGLLQHVSRIERRRAERDDRHRQGHGETRGLRKGRRDLRHRAKSRDESPADADGAGGGQGPRCDDRVDQSAAGSGHGAV
jgi:hypothetical protein